MAQPWDHSTCWSLWDSFQRSQVQGLPQLHSKVNSLRRARGVEKKRERSYFSFCRMWRNGIHWTWQSLNERSCISTDRQYQKWGNWGFLCWYRPSIFTKSWVVDRGESPPALIKPQKYSEWKDVLWLGRKKRNYMNSTIRRTSTAVGSFELVSVFWN